MTGKESLPPYKDKEKEKESRKKEEADPRGYPFDHFAVTEYSDTLKPEPELSIFQAETIAEAVADSAVSRAVWSDVLRIFKGNDYQRRHAGNAVDRYRSEMLRIQSGKRDAPIPAERVKTIRERMAAR